MLRCKRHERRSLQGAELAFVGCKLLKARHFRAEPGVDLYQSIVEIRLLCSDS
jgi:hypothetical protein